MEFNRVKFETILDESDKLKLKSVEKIVDKLLAMPYIRMMIAEGKNDQVRKHLEELLDNSLLRKNEPVLVKLKDGTQIDMVKVLCWMCIEDKLKLQILYRNIGYGLARIVLVGVVAGLGFGLIRLGWF
jgi:hypothetical protein